MHPIVAALLAQLAALGIRELKKLASADPLVRGYSRYTKAQLKEALLASHRERHPDLWEEQGVHRERGLKLPAKCPRCNLHVESEEDVEEFFGFRNAKHRTRAGLLITTRCRQSNCKACRSRLAALRRKAKRDAAHCEE
jgi:hypothetical protein